MKLPIAMLLAVVSGAAAADHMPTPTNEPKSFKTECGSCHLPFPPSLLTASDWHKVMTGLDKHYGDDASLDEATRRQLEDFLIRNSGAERKLAGAGDPPRLTGTSWFKREHDEIPSSIWRDRSVKSAANCSACHSRADQGSFRERELVMPGGRRHHDND
jgi:nitrate/TMAO reductase-like tetraheme cytochrome c subunit